MSKRFITEEQKKESRELVEALKKAEEAEVKAQKNFHDQADKVWAAYQKLQEANVKFGRDSVEAQEANKAYRKLQEQRDYETYIAGFHKREAISHNENFNRPIIRELTDHLRGEMNKVNNQTFVREKSRNKSIFTDRTTVTFESNLKIVKETIDFLSETRRRILALTNGGSLEEIEGLFNQALQKIDEVDLSKSETMQTSSDRFKELLDSLPSNVSFQEAQVLSFAENPSILDRKEAILEKEFEKIKAQVRK